MGTLQTSAPIDRSIKSTIKGSVAVVKSENKVADNGTPVIPREFFHACMVPPRVTSLASLKTVGSNKKKAKKSKHNRFSELADTAAASLKANGWAVVDNFAGLETIEKVRIEIRQLETQYEKGTRHSTIDSTTKYVKK
jgi:hypothetical protein